MKTIIGLAAALSVSACSTLPTSGPSAEQLCRSTLNNYFVAIDNHDWSIIPKTFTEDVTVTLVYGSYTGHDELTAYFKARDPQPDIVHHLTTVVIDETGPDTASGTVYLMLHGNLPSATGEPKALIYSGYYEDEYDLSDGSCKISKRKLNTNYLHQIDHD